MFFARLGTVLVMNVALGLIPDGLVRCKVCGELHGRGLAPDPPDGPGSRRCPSAACATAWFAAGAGSGGCIARITNHYDERTGQVIHMPWFSVWRECSVCGERDWVTDYPAR